MQCAQRSSLAARQEAVRAAPAFSHRVAPQSFKHCGKLSPSCMGGAARRVHLPRAPTRLQAGVRPSICLFSFGADDDEYEEDYTVLKVQVGIFGDVRKWQNDLERLSELYDTDEEESLHYILQETVTKLLRNMDYCGYGQTAGKVFNDLDACEQKFNQVSLEERTKFKEETFSNVDGRRRVRAMDITASTDTGLDSWLCATIVVALEGKLVLPKINSLADMRKALSMLGSVPSDSMLAFELLWTPQADGDSYSKDELLTDFPTLATL
ncbi:hypothetical protein TSOC_000944 [Tetrabaena socialis]|uniref:DUF1517 domain-containing protein n=1 Tax=Tetrabaena socialis TaxID=47790 RepID=A0A2J8AI37_9CHLO|nr:hypothetical protein TSOC_000944 [Tetrabaena socialis]|eukprot:PNH12171.1 hypothetical protein TSOC_000944 [Tetrabaena socialis]